jgi:MoxR-like ATPase
MDHNERIPAVAQFGARLNDQIGRVIIGKSDVIELLTVALLCGGHVLIEDVPGIGKTTLAKTLARCLSCSFSRIQFTPDLLPSDITGIFYFNQKSGDFEFRAGPIQAHVILADEINRATPRTQSALLEAMGEGQVTVEGQTAILPQPFLVLATQNPIEMEGTFPLPEAQLDRFFLRTAIGYPNETEESAILRRFQDGANAPLEQIEAVATGPEVMEMAEAVHDVHVSDAVADYVVALARASRDHEAVELGASPRASLALLHGAQALAALQGRDFVVPDDVKRLVLPVLGHRLILRQQGRLWGSAVERVLHSILESVTVPAEPLPRVLP